MKSLNSVSNSSGIPGAGGWGRKLIASGMLATCWAAPACSGESNSEQVDDSGPAAGGNSGSTSSGGASTSSGASTAGGDSTTGGGSTGAAGASTTGGSADAGGSDSGTTGGTDEGGAGGGSGGTCAARSSVTLAVRSVVPVTWPGSLGTQSGGGDFNIWNRYTMTADGTVLEGRSSPCGSVLPPLSLTILVGGGMTLIEIPAAVWDMESFPDFPISATIDGWETGSSLTTTPATTLIGSMMDDPQGAWPESSTDLMPVDMDGDGNPGITGIPRPGDGYRPPPVSAIGGPEASTMYLSSRTELVLEGQFTSCTELSGSATLQRLDGHVLGCETTDGEPCTDSQTEFLDDNRTVYEPMPGTFTAKIVDDDATCEEVRMALPM